MFGNGCHGNRDNKSRVTGKNYDTKSPILHTHPFPRECFGIHNAI